MTQFRQNRELWHGHWIAIKSSSYLETTSWMMSIGVINAADAWHFFAPLNVPQICEVKTMVKKLSLALFCAVVFAGLSSTAASASTFNFTYSGITDTGSGLFTASLTGTPGQYLITGITGTWDSVNIDSLIAPGNYPIAAPPPNDNLLFLGGGPFLDIGGVSFLLANGTDVNIFYSSDPSIPPIGYFAVEGTSETVMSPNTASTFTVTPTPEPGSLMLLGTGALGLVGMMRRRYAV